MTRFIEPLQQVQSKVTSSDGVELAVYVYGEFDSNQKTILGVHGYPDNHHIWDDIAAHIKAEQDINFISYDVRGTGSSAEPRDVSGYKLEQLAADIDAVIDSFGATGVHLIAHDWGAIQSWTALHGSNGVYRPRGNIASFTSISGPDLNFAGEFIHRGWKNVGIVKYLRQFLGSTYIPYFLSPRLPELSIKLGITQKILSWLSLAGTHGLYTKKEKIARSQRDYLNGLNLYRANMPQPFIHPAKVRVDIPVHLIVPSGDLFVSPALQISQVDKIPQAKVTKISGGHWVVESRPDIIADVIIAGIKEFAHSVEKKLPLVSTSSVKDLVDNFHGKIALITGAGSGIGRCIALELARRGIGLIIVVDRDIAAAEETVKLLEQSHIAGIAYECDVSDRDAVLALADKVKSQQGGIDILFNNAGIGMAGRFLETSAEAFDKIIGVNLLGAINFSRVFAQQMIEQGRAGSIINISSASAYLPSKSMVAYSTTKAAVLAFSECLRADLIDDGIKVMAVCPGFVNTNIAKNTSYQGLSAEAEAQARAKADAAYKKRNYTPEKTAKVIVNSLKSMPPVVAVSPEAKFMYFMSKVFPAFIRLFARFDIRLQ